MAKSVTYVVCDIVRGFVFRDNENAVRPAKQISRLSQLIVALGTVNARSTCACRCAAAARGRNTRDARYTQDPAASRGRNGLSGLSRLWILYVWDRFDKILLFFEQENFNGELSRWKLSKCLRKGRDSGLEIRNQPPALHFGGVCEQQKMIRRHLKPLRVLRAHAGT